MSVIVLQTRSRGMITCPPDRVPARGHGTPWGATTIDGFIAPMI
jgi:hypothetical protein